jgi:hypothetical protein
MEEYEWNELVYNSKFSLNQSLKFTIYIEMRSGKLSFVDGPQEWNKNTLVLN